ncbi:chitinase CLP-like [Lolium perenne]|uniref:chitinase CLP-like n=1 Tax=Lolium perenne TaxID=4522 RepID=UPI0021F570F9|nr:chitinase CLP-like [Lolium perenne]
MCSTVSSSRHSSCCCHAHARWRTVTGNHQMISKIAKDPVTSLYTISIKADQSPLVVDLAGSLVWSTCPPSAAAHSTVQCESATCAMAKEQSPPRCRYVDGGRFWENRQPGSTECACTVHPLNPVTGECSTGDLTSLAMSANTTNGTMELRPEESFAVLGACAPSRLLTSLPVGATGVAGLSRGPLSLPSQLTAQRGFGNKFALCLPDFAIFGDTPVYLSVPDPRIYIDYTTTIPYTPLVTNPANTGGHYIPVKGISVSWHAADATAALPRGGLDIDVRTGRGGVVLSTTTPYTIMRPDVFRAFAMAFDDAIMRGKIPMTTMRRVQATKPFELCYNGAFPMLKRSGYDMPYIKLELGNGATRNWTLFNSNYMVQVEGAMCVGILPMGPRGMPVAGEPAVVIGGKQLEDNLLVFDLEKQRLGFSMLLPYQLSSCRSSNFFRN